MIVKRSGISRSLINYYFPKKQDILVTFLGNYLDSIIEFVKEQGDYNAILVYMLSTSLYAKEMFKTEKTRRFHLDVMLRTDREVGPYKNYEELYKNILLEYNVDMNDAELFLKEIAIFGAQIELIGSIAKGKLKLPAEQVQNEVMINSLTLLKIPYVVIHKNLDKFEAEYAKLSKTEFPLFD